MDGMVLSKSGIARNACPLLPYWVSPLRYDEREDVVRSAEYVRFTVMPVGFCQ